MRPRIAVLDGHFKQPFFSPLVRAFDADWHDVAAPSAIASTLDADLVLVNDETWPYHAAALPELHRRGIPTLHLMGGMLQWRHVWETPWHQPFLRPVLASKVACLGEAQARILEAWGNPGKCEVTGSHRFDHLIGRTPRVREGRWRLLIATGREPHVNDPRADALVRQSLVDVKGWLDRHLPVDPVWRLTGNLARELGVENAFATDLGEQLASVDAVLTTPSTLMLEAMLCGLPVAVLDYADHPQYVHGAWCIAAPSQMDAVFGGLERPAAERMRHQNIVFHDNLSCDTPATPRIVALMEEMIEIGRRARTDGSPLRLPPAMIEAPRHRPAAPIPVDERAELEAEIGHLRYLLRERPIEKAYRALCELRRLLG